MLIFDEIGYFILSLLPGVVLLAAVDPAAQQSARRIPRQRISRQRGSNWWLLRRTRASQAAV